MESYLIWCPGHIYTVSQLETEKRRKNNSGWNNMYISVVGFTTTYMQSVTNTTKLVSSNPAHGEVFSMHHYVIKFVSDLR